MAEELEVKEFPLIRSLVSLELCIFNPRNQSPAM